MGIYVNPGNGGFKRIAGPDYVDIKMLIDLMNARIGTARSLVCISRTRRFGKSYAVKMLAANYDCSCDSHSRFLSHPNSLLLIISAQAAISQGK